MVEGFTDSESDEDVALRDEGVSDCADLYLD